MITLTVNTTTLTLPDDMYWADEASWSPVVQAVERTVTGAMIVSTYGRIGGRPITLQPESDTSAWMSRATLDQLLAWAGVQGQQLTLNLRGTNHTVLFRHHDGEVVIAAPVVHYTDVADADWYRVTLKFMEI
jgi:hypothetical protein